MRAEQTRKRDGEVDGVDPLDEEAAVALEAAATAAAEAVPSDPFAPERIADRMLAALRLTRAIPIFDFTDPAYTLSAEPDDAMLAARKDAADFLVRSRLARFSDSLRSDLAINNAGRYWALHGGFMGYLKEDMAARGAGASRQPNPEAEALRTGYMKLMQMRLNTFWWSFGISIAGFLLSVISITVALIWGGRLWR